MAKAIEHGTVADAARALAKAEREKKKAPSKKAAKPKGHTPLDSYRCKSIEKKERVDWSALLGAARATHWKHMLVTIRFREQVHGGKPAALDAAKAMIKARGLEDQIVPLPEDPEGREVAAEEASLSGLCEFYQREGRPGCWFPSNHLKAMFKENWSVLEFSRKVRGSKTKLAECLFCYGVNEEDREWLWMGDIADGTDTRPCHTQTPQGKISTIKRNKFVEGVQISFVVRLARDVEHAVPDDYFAAMLVHAESHGFGANRSQGHGTFDLVDIKETPGWPTVEDIPKGSLLPPEMCE
jgi:hypothetical protein